MEILCITVVFAVLAFFGAYIELNSQAVERFNGTKTLPAVASSSPMLDITTTTISKKVVIIIEQPYEHAHMQDVTARPTIDPPAVASASLTKNTSSQHEMLSVPSLARATSANAAPLPAPVTATPPALPPTATLQYGQSSDTMFEKTSSTFLLSHENMERFFASAEAAVSKCYCRLVDPWSLYSFVRDIVRAATNTRTHSTRASSDSTAGSSTTSSRTVFTWLPWTPPAACLWLLASRRKRQRALGAISGLLYKVQSMVSDIPSLLSSLLALVSMSYTHTSHHLHQVLRRIQDVPWLDIMMWLLSVIAWILSTASVTLKCIGVSLVGLAITAAMILLAAKPGFQACAIFIFEGACDCYHLASPKVQKFFIWLLPITRQVCEAICTWTFWLMASSRHLVASRLNREQEYGEPIEIEDPPIATPVPERYGDEDFFKSKSEYDRLTPEEQTRRARHEAWLAGLAAHARSLPQRPSTIPSAPIPRSYFIEQARNPPRPLEYEPERPLFRGQIYRCPPVLKNPRKSPSASPVSFIVRPASLAPWRRTSRSIAPELETRSVPKLDSTRCCLKQQPTEPAKTSDHKVATAAPNEAKHVQWSKPCISEIALCTALVNPGFVPLFPTASTTDMFHATDSRGIHYQGWSAFDYNNVMKYIQELTADKHEACKSVADRKGKSVGYYIAVVLHNIMQSEEGQKATKDAWGSISASATEEQVRAFKVATELKTSYSPMAPTQQESRLRTPHQITPAFTAIPSASFSSRNTQAFNQPIIALQTQAASTPTTSRPFAPVPAAPPAQMAPVAQAAVPTQPPVEPQMSVEAVAQCDAYLAKLGIHVVARFVVDQGWGHPPYTDAQGKILLDYLAKVDSERELKRNMTTVNAQGSRLHHSQPAAFNVTNLRNAMPLHQPTKSATTASETAKPAMNTSQTLNSAATVFRTPKPTATTPLAPNMFNNQAAIPGLPVPMNPITPIVKAAGTLPGSQKSQPSPANAAKLLQNIRENCFELRSDNDGIPFLEVILAIVKPVCQKVHRRGNVACPQTVNDLTNDFWLQLNLDKDELQMMHLQVKKQLDKFKTKHRS